VRTKGQEEEDMGQLYLIQLDGRFYSCSQCRSHLANCNELLSKVITHSFSLLLFLPPALLQVKTWFVCVT
jgi:hypothetical protein